MAETTLLSMARSMLGSAVSKAAAAAAEEMSLLMGVQKEIWYDPTVFLAVALVSIHCLLLSGFHSP